MAGLAAVIAPVAVERAMNSSAAVVTSCRAAVWGAWSPGSRGAWAPRSRAVISRRMLAAKTAQAAQATRTMTPYGQGAVVGGGQRLADLVEGGDGVRDRGGPEPDQGGGDPEQDGEQGQGGGQAGQADAQCHWGVPPTARVTWAWAWPVTVRVWMPISDRNLVV